eukprot:NODE_22_length_42145_cov_1.310612.p12 type:complete len:366 gc:universal NODE_22_length_42145_cov_1.310612:15533-14436(-)
MLKLKGWTTRKKNNKLPPLAMSAFTKHILAEKRFNALVLTLNRPSKLNALNIDMVKELKKHFDSSGLKIIQSDDKKAFCAGGDVVELLDDENLGKQFFKEEYKMNLSLYNRRQERDTVAIVNGICLGGGVGISGHAPFVVVTENVRYGMPETAIGLHPDIGGSFMLPRYKGGVGLLLGLTGLHVTSPWLLREIGFASHFVPSQKVPHLIRELGNINKIEKISKVIDEFSEPPIATERDHKIFEVANDCFLNQSLIDTFESLAEKDNCKLCKELLSKLNSASPTSLLLTHRLYHLKAETLVEALKNEYRVSSKLLKKGSDFHVGVTTRLVHKSKDPVAWKYKTISDVPPKIIDEFFYPVPDDFSGN